MDLSPKRRSAAAFDSKARVSRTIPISSPISPPKILRSAKILDGSRRRDPVCGWDRARGTWIDSWETSSFGLLVLVERTGAHYIGDLISCETTKAKSFSGCYI